MSGSRVDTFQTLPAKRITNTTQNLAMQLVEHSTVGETRLSEQSRKAYEVAWVLHSLQHQQPLQSLLPECLLHPCMPALILKNGVYFVFLLSLAAPLMIRDRYSNFFIAIAYGTNICSSWQTHRALEHLFASCALFKMYSHFYGRVMMLM